MVISSDYLHADETPVKVLGKNKKGTTRCGFSFFKNLNF